MDVDTYDEADDDTYVIVEFVAKPKTLLNNMNMTKVMALLLNNGSIYL